MKAILEYIGRIRTPYTALGDCPRNINPGGPECELVLEPAFAEGVSGLEAGQEILVLYWFEEVHRHSLTQEPRGGGPSRGVFALRSPHRPNPIAAGVVAINRIQGRRIFVNGLDCLDGTPLLDIKPAGVKEGPA